MQNNSGFIKTIRNKEKQKEKVKEKANKPIRKNQKRFEF
jgi:uncharacterized protein YeeX (DUF496 family)